jgi:hypothetical protein
MPEGRPQYRTRRDANQPALVFGLEQLGFQVYDISTLPDKQCPGDILVYGWHGALEQWTWQPFEVKTRTGRLSKRQRELAEADAVPVARRVEDVLDWYSR